MELDPRMEKEEEEEEQEDYASEESSEVDSSWEERPSRKLSKKPTKKKKKRPSKKLIKKKKNKFRRNRRSDSSMIDARAHSSDVDYDDEYSSSNGNGRDEKKRGMDDDDPLLSSRIGDNSYYYGYICDFCFKDIGRTKHIECAVCADIHLCENCHRQGSELPPHRKEHDFHWIEPLTELDEQLYQLERVERYGWRRRRNNNNINSHSKWIQNAEEKSDVDLELRDEAEIEWFEDEAERWMSQTNPSNDDFRVYQCILRLRDRRRHLSRDLKYAGKEPEPRIEKMALPLIPTEERRRQKKKKIHKHGDSPSPTTTTMRSSIESGSRKGRRKRRTSAKKSGSPGSPSSSIKRSTKKKKKRRIMNVRSQRDGSSSLSLSSATASVTSMISDTTKSGLSASPSPEPITHKDMDLEMVRSQQTTPERIRSEMMELCRPLFPFTGHPDKQREIQNVCLRCLVKVKILKHQMILRCNLGQTQMQGGSQANCRFTLLNLIEKKFVLDHGIEEAIFTRAKLWYFYNCDRNDFEMEFSPFIGKDQTSLLYQFFLDQSLPPPSADNH